LSATRPQPGAVPPGSLPAAIRHVVAFCHARQHKGVEVAVRREGSRRFVVTARRRDGLELALTFARRSRGWDLAGYRAVKDGEPVDIADVAAALALLGQREGTAGTSPVRAGPPQRRNDVEARRDSVIRV
jgi:hypothetical protein